MIFFFFSLFYVFVFFCSLSGIINCKKKKNRCAIRKILFFFDILLRSFWIIKWMTKTHAQKVREREMEKTRYLNYVDAAITWNFFTKFTLLLFICVYNAIVRFVYGRTKFFNIQFSSFFFFLLQRKSFNTDKHITKPIKVHFITYFFF